MIHNLTQYVIKYHAICDTLKVGEKSLSRRIVYNVNDRSLYLRCCEPQEGSGTPPVFDRVLISKGVLSNKCKVV